MDNDDEGLFNSLVAEVQDHLDELVEEEGLAEDDILGVVLQVMLDRVSEVTCGDNARTVMMLRGMVDEAEKMLKDGRIAPASGVDAVVIH